MPTTAALRLVGAGLCATAQMQAAIIAEDPFLANHPTNPGSGEYTGNGLGGQNPTLTGWGGAWDKRSTHDVIGNPMGLSYPGFASSGGCGSAPDGTRSGHPLAAAYDDGTEATVYLSVLMKMDQDAPGPHRTMELHYGGYDDGPHRKFQLGQSQSASATPRPMSLRPGEPHPRCCAIPLTMARWASGPTSPRPTPTAARAIGAPARPPSPAATWLVTAATRSARRSSEAIRIPDTRRCGCGHPNSPSMVPATSALGSTAGTATAPTPPFPAEGGGAPHGAPHEGAHFVGLHPPVFGGEPIYFWDSPDDTIWLRSPGFKLDGSGLPMFVHLVGGGAGSSLPSNNPSDVPAASTNPGFRGIVLRNADSDEF